MCVCVCGLLAACCHEQKSVLCENLIRRHRGVYDHSRLERNNEECGQPEGFTEVCLKAVSAACMQLGKEFKGLKKGKLVTERVTKNLAVENQSETHTIGFTVATSHHIEEMLRAFID